MLGLFLFKQIDVLENRIGSPTVPAAGEKLLGGNRKNEFVLIVVENIPTEADMFIHGEGTILRQNIDSAQAGIEAVGEGKVDDAVDASERDRGLGSPLCQRIKPFSLAAGENQRQGSAQQVGAIDHKDQLSIDLSE